MRRRALLRKSENMHAIPALPLIEIVGDQRVLVEHHKGVLGYDKNKICIKLSFGMVLVNGCNLEITHMSKAQLVITGKIHDVAFRRSSN